MSQKLLNSLSELVNKNVISEAVANDIQKFYEPVRTDSQNRLYTIFGVIGSTLVGLGIILIIAHNWDNINRFTKSLIAFVPLLIGQIFAGICILKKKNNVWSEATATFYFFAIGSCLALISQIYNIQGEIYTFLLQWILLSSPLLYILKSKAVGFLYLIFITVYACNYGYFFFSEASTPWMYLLLISIFIPQYVNSYRTDPKGKTLAIYNWLLPLSLIISLGTFVTPGSGFGYIMYIALFGCFFALGKSELFINLKTRQNGFLVIGSIGIKIILFMASFKSFWNQFQTITVSISQDIFITTFLILINIGLIIRVNNSRKINKNDLLLITPVIFLMTVLLSIQFELVSTVLINLLIIVIGLFIVAKSLKHLDIVKMNFGLLIITLLILCRFFDSGISFVNRGLLFVIFGIGFFLSNYIMINRKTKKLNTGK